MILSDEQMAVVRHGTKQPPATWEWVDLPVGPQPLPHWAKGLEIRWMDEYVNSPSFTLKTPKGFDMRNWPGKCYTKYGSRYLAESGDGRAMCYYHEGELALRPLPARYKFLTVYANPPPRNKHGYIELDHYFPMHWSRAEVMCWATTQDRGFGGEHVGIQLEDGRKAVLRGPWHGPAPDGYQDCGSTGSGGILISEDVLILMVARFYPHCRVARITQGTRSRIEPVREDWEMPKAWVDAARRGK